MKRLVAAILIAVLILSFCACKKDEGTEVSVTAPPMPTGDALTDEEEDISKIKVGFSLAGEGAFYDQLISDIKAQCASQNYDPQIMTANTADQQQQDILSLLATGSAVIVLDPVNVDKLESVLSECETQNVPVISIIDQVNGMVNMLISPYYKTVGELAGQYAVDLFGKDGGSCMMLKTNPDSFKMQLMSDGFIDKIDADKDVALLSESFCGDDEEKAYTLVSEALKTAAPTAAPTIAPTDAQTDAPETAAPTKEPVETTAVNFIFAQSSALARGAMKAIDEAGADTQLVVYGGDMDIIEAVESGDIYAALFIGPGQVAGEAIYYANKFILSQSYKAPQFDELSIGVATAENVAEYLSDTALHAEVNN